MRKIYKRAAILSLVVLLVGATGLAVGYQGNDFEDAEPIDEGETQGEIVDGESDFYKIDANDTDALDLEVAAASGNILLRVYNEDRDVIVDDTGGFGGRSERSVTYKLPETGTYFIEIEGDGEQVTTDYTVNLDIVTPSENDQFAPNDDFESAADLSEGFSDATIWGGESDFYEIEANDTDALDLEATADNGNILLRVYNEDREEIITDTGGFGGRSERGVTYKLPETGTYYIEIEGDGQQVTTDYTVDLDIVTPSENDQFAPNDDFESAAPITERFSDATIWGGESDFFRVGLNASDELDVRVTAESANILLRVYASNRSVIAEDTGGFGGSQERQVTVEVPEQGTYFVEVEGDGQQVTTDYTLRSNQTGSLPNEPPTADAGPDQTVSAEQPVELDAGGSSDPDGDTLSYSWTQTAGPDVSLTDADTATPGFTAPAVDSETVLRFEVAVSDGTATDTDTVGVTVTPEQGPPPVTGEDPPTDTDGDGQFEDVDGDGELTIFDVRALFNNLNSDVVQNNQQFFNFDGENGIDIFDVRALFNELV